MWALLFDLDGTLANTNDVHELAWRDVLAGFGIALSPDGFRTHISGRANPDIVRHFLPDLDLTRTRALIKHKEAMFRKGADHLTAPRGLNEVVSFAVAERARLAVVTNAPQANARHVLDVLGLGAHFELIVAAEDVTQPKPQAEPYLRAAAQLGVCNACCLAIEDSPSGVRSAVAASIAVAGLTTGHAASELQREGATPVVADFADQALWSILRALPKRCAGRVSDK